VKIGVYIIHKLYRSLTLFHTLQLKHWNLYTLMYFLVHVHLNSANNLAFTLPLTYEDSHCHFSWNKVVFLFLKYLNYTPFENNSKNSYLKYNQYTFHKYQTTIKLQSRSLRIFGVDFLFFIIYMNFYVVIKSISNLTYVYLQ
jgi:hypothetical protein